MSNATASRTYWFVGAYDGTQDQTAEFVRNGVWENGYEDRYLETVRSVQVGDRIAIKSSYVRKNGLPFDNRGHPVSVMAIKAVGTVTENRGDGRNLRVEWEQPQAGPPREWYFYTIRSTIWGVRPGDWKSDALIAFGFDKATQDFERFQNDPYWRERFGTAPRVQRRFQWTPFYESMANKLLPFRHDRATLVAAIHAIAGRVKALGILQDKFADGTSGPLKDICPFTALGLFNRGITEDNRKAIAQELAGFLGVTEPVPASFEAIPILNNQRSWFFRYEKDRQPNDIDVLWDVFAAALKNADSDEPNARESFASAFDAATGLSGVSWNLTMGLYWVRPWVFAPLDDNSRTYLKKTLSMPIGRSGNKLLPTGAEYLDLLDAMVIRFSEEGFPVHSYPEFSLAAWYHTVPTNDPEPAALDQEDDGNGQKSVTPPPEVPLRPYSADDILADGCFLERTELDRAIERLRTKKNLILQGPPGTGKTWLAKRLGFALMGQRDESRMRVVQFHPNMSYEDFVRGWRPTGEGKLALVEGPVMEVVRDALKTPAARHVVVIEEINRGNPAQIFGEMLTLLEADKRTPSEAIELCHRRTEGERVYIPDNVYFIGTMNIADRSLALVDFAFRRRFAFVDLEPRLGPNWRQWVTSRCGVDAGVLDEMERRILALNEQIAADPSLGKPYRIGHSFVTPPVGVVISNAWEWFLQVVDTEIGPLLEEYWFDAREKALDAKNRLTAGL